VLLRLHTEHDELHKAQSTARDKTTTHLARTFVYDVARSSVDGL